MKNKTKIKMVFSIFGDEFIPTNFTEYIGIEPSIFWSKGDEILNRKGLLRKESSWDYSIGFFETLFFNEISKMFLDVFETKIERIIDYVKINRLEVKVFIISEIEEETPALFFDKPFLNIINKLNAEIDIDLYT